MANTATVQRDHLIVIAADSTNMLLRGELAHLPAAIIEHDRVGGTCLNRGGIPAKMLAGTADAPRAVGQAHRLRAHATLERVNRPTARASIVDRIDPVQGRATAYRGEHEA